MMKMCTRCGIGFKGTTMTMCNPCAAKYRAERKAKGGFKCHSCHKTLMPGESHNNQCRECHAEYASLYRKTAAQGSR